MPPTPRKKTPAARKPAATRRGNARSNIGDAINSEFTPEYARELMQAAKEATVGIPFSCPECGTESRVRFPDLKGIVSTLTTLLEQAEGRPELRQPDALSIVIERPARPAA